MAAELRAGLAHAEIRRAQRRRLAIFKSVRLARRRGVRIKRLRPGGAGRSRGASQLERGELTRPSARPGQILQHAIAGPAAADSVGEGANALARQREPVGNAVHQDFDAAKIRTEALGRNGDDARVSRRESTRSRSRAASEKILRRPDSPQKGCGFSQGVARSSRRPNAMSTMYLATACSLNSAW